MVLKTLLPKGNGGVGFFVITRATAPAAAGQIVLSSAGREDLRVWVASATPPAAYPFNNSSQEFLCCLPNKLYLDLVRFKVGGGPTPLHVGSRHPSPKASHVSLTGVPSPRWQQPKLVSHLSSSGAPEEPNSSRVCMTHTCACTHACAMPTHVSHVK